MLIALSKFALFPSPFPFFPHPPPSLLSFRIFSCETFRRFLSTAARNGRPSTKKPTFEGGRWRKGVGIPRFCPILFLTILSTTIIPSPRLRLVRRDSSAATGTCSRKDCLSPTILSVEEEEEDYFFRRDCPDRPDLEWIPCFPEDVTRCDRDGRGRAAVVGDISFERAPTCN